MLHDTQRSAQVGKYPDLDRDPHKAITMMIAAMGLFFILAMLWMYFGSLSISVHAQGKVVPSSKVQNVQSLEGGILKELFVKEGDAVKQYDLVARIENVQFHSELGESEQNYWSMLAASARLDAEINNHDPEFPREVFNEAPEIVERERRLWTIRVQEHRAAIATATSQLEQKRQELLSTHLKVAGLTKNLGFAKESLEIEARLTEKNVGARADYLSADAKVNQILGDLKVAKAEVPRLNAAVLEAQSRINEAESVYRSDARKQRNELLAKISALTELMRGMQDKVSRSDLRAPMSGIVNRVLLNTIGGVVKAGENVMEIVPVEDKLQITVQVKPADMAFIHVDQPAKVRITAYDSSIFGSLDGKVIKVGADAILDERKENTYFDITLETDRNYLGKKEDKLTITPGMVADASIKTGQRTVLEYLLKPVVKTFRQSLQER
jgi:adhesin transport system membrane fusion protein